MRKIGATTGLVAVIGSALAATAHAACPAGADTLRAVDGGGTCLAMTVSGHATAGAAPKLVVLLHGDVSDGGPADYLYPVAQSLAKEGVVAVALIRPGYSDTAGGSSQGSNNGRRDHYTPTNISIIGSAIENLKARYKASRVVVMGHSGGAAITGVLLGQKPGLIDAAALVSCPCDIPRWRAERNKQPWTASLSPQAFVGRVPKSTTTVVTITGSTDDNTSPGLAKAYVGALSSRGVNARHQDVPGAGHGFKALTPVVTATLRQLL